MTLLPRHWSRRQRLGLALALAVTCPVAGCASLTEPGNGAPPAAREEAPAPAMSVEIVNPTPAAPTPPPPEPMAGASHVLIQYKGSTRADPKITRTKEEAKKLATEVMAKAKKGQDFAELARKYSDEPGAKDRAGSLGKFQRTAMVKPFADATFALKPGEISDVVETQFGFHVIKRTE